MNRRQYLIDRRRRESERFAAARIERMVHAEEWMDEHDRTEADWKRYQVESLLPDGVVGPFRVRHINPPARNYRRLDYILEGGRDRDPGRGPFVVVDESTPAGRQVWMSDTRAEIIEHRPVLDRLVRAGRRGHHPRVLINGLGLGMIARAALLHGAAHVDVVERSADVIALTGPMFDGDHRLTIHHADAYTADIAGTWDIAWHDIWPEISDLNLPGMDVLHRRYAGRAKWQGSWMSDGCREMARIMRQVEEWRAVFGDDLDNPKENPAEGLPSTGR